MAEARETRRDDGKAQHKILLTPAKMFPLLVPSILLTLPSVLAQETCRYEFTVPRPQEGCLHTSKSLEDRLLQLEVSVSGLTKESETTDVSKTAIHDITSLARAVASVEDQQKNLKNKFDDLTSNAVKEDELKSVIQELTDVMDNMTAKTDTRLDLMTASVQRFFNSLTSLESSVHDQLRQNHGRLALYLQELLDVKKQVADAVVNTNTTGMNNLVQNFEDLKKTLYTSLGVNKARYDEGLKKEVAVAGVLKNHTEEIKHLKLNSEAMVEHTHVMTDNIKHISDTLETLDKYTRLKIAELVEKTYMIANDEPLTEDEQVTSYSALNSSMKKDAIIYNITAKIQASFQRLGEQLNHFTSREADEDVNKLGGQIVEVDEGDQARSYTKDFTKGPSVVQLEEIQEGTEEQRQEESSGLIQDSRLQELRREVMSVQYLYQQLVDTYRSSGRC